MVLRDIVDSLPQFNSTLTVSISNTESLKVHLTPYIIDVTLTCVIMPLVVRMIEVQRRSSDMDQPFYLRHPGNHRWPHT